MILRQNEHDKSAAHHHRLRNKGIFGACLYTSAVPLAFASVYISYGVFVLMPLCFIPDPKIEELAGQA